VSTPAAYFEAMYEQAVDPWHLGTRWYERRKHALTVACLSRERYNSAFEPGCSLGALTALLAPRCRSLLATDRVAAAVTAASDRLAGQAGVRVTQLAVPYQWPDQRFDLVVLSEIGYYLDPADLAVLITAAVGSLEPGGELVAVHWRHAVGEHAMDGDAVHDQIRAHPELQRITDHREDDFALEVFVRVPPAPVSVAAREGLC